MNKMKIDLKKLIKKYGGEWIALNEGLIKVVARGKHATQALEIANKKGTKTPFLFKVPTKLKAYVGYNA